MAKCKHEFIGDSEGVHCIKCGLKLTAEEYAEYCKPKKAEKEKKVKEDE